MLAKVRALNKRNQAQAHLQQVFKISIYLKQRNTRNFARSRIVSLNSLERKWQSSGVYVNLHICAGL